MNGNARRHTSSGIETEALAHRRDDPVEYVGFRVDGHAVVLNLSEHQRLTPDRSLDLVNHSPTGFEWGYAGSGPAQLACGLLLDYYDDAQVAREHYIAFRNRVISQLECDGPAACWHLTGEEIDAAMATITDDVVALPDGGQLSPSLPENWRTVTRPDRRRREQQPHRATGGGVLMETLRLSRATHQLIERGVEALEKIGRELERYNDRQEQTDGTDS